MAIVSELTIARSPLRISFARTRISPVLRIRGPLHRVHRSRHGSKYCLVHILVYNRQPLLGLPHTCSLVVEYYLGLRACTSAPRIGSVRMMCRFRRQNILAVTRLVPLPYGPMSMARGPGPWTDLPMAPASSNRGRLGAQRALPVTPTNPSAGK